MKCIFCEKEFPAKRESAKFCCTNCRVKYHKKFGRKQQAVVTEVKLQVLYNSILELAGKLNNAVTPILERPQIPITNSPPPEWASKSVEKSFQQHMNELAELDTEYEYRQKAQEIDKATNLSQKQKELILLNMRQSKL